MELIFIENKKNKYFKKAWKLYLDSFPEIERRTLEEQEEILTDKNFKMTCYVEDEVLISIVFYWKISSYTFLEHFAVNSELRGQSFGSKILQKFINDKKNIVLEIEPIVDEITQKRLKFYKKFGFVVNSHEHLQIPFREGAKELKLLLMSQEKTLSQQEYKVLYESMKKSLKRF
ncbi:GNAT family N-acetyltransferase [Halarcobacter sp.]|uniref:GNAT family N-acetyltransferase n=1 Tax=Halarcobacter sp. TaxID=2321133 RepID=UPI003A9192F7